MERPSALKNYNPYRFLVIFYIVGLTGHLIPASRSSMLTLTPLALLISGITILIPFIEKKEWRILIFFIICGVIGFIAEMTGVNYGILFGDYSYGKILGFGIFGVPLIIGLNWIVIFTGSLSISEMLFKNKIFRIIAAFFLSVIFDYIMEPVAVFFRYWTWDGDIIPLTNYLTWGAIIFVFSAIAVIFEFKVKHKLPAFLFIIQLVYFLILRIIISFQII